ncbi:replication initiation protein RepM, partial [Halomonas sp. AOP42-A1-14]|uniref:replication initiation protein RepM n=1 Tax=Halomonas sp. AOP42-A1-14 TaxID=3457676 RepID=UPI0040334CA1
MRKKQQQLVVKDNALINAAYRLDLTEQRLILMSTVRAREDGQGITTDKPLTVRAEDYAEQFKVTRQAAYMALKEATTGLFERQFTYEQLTKRGNREVVKSRWVSRVSYIESEGQVSIVFAPDVVHLITRLEKEFTRYDLEQVSGLKSTYAVRLYELLISWRRLGKTPEIELSEFRQQLGVADDEYVDMQNFKRRVLDLAIKQINEHTDITASYEQHKRGRRIVGFEFTFQVKRRDRDPDTVDWVNDKTDASSSSKKRRKVITKAQADAMGKLGE